ncbi:MAG TPA: biopolymer transporter ExbD [Leptospiraceae bacterium]|nr:biopolymer transporter ExbD [Leptospiraceae bacterium]HMW03745.1 biopolymer transporter ExbD [Leptospiraceae bacterium]HMX31858.1 biopolymer transporter ExbD [Leptospiraceae bacterium]HMY29725.1 biopolymer transporter ExbD [Leptospiraceae bacterium]HMZ62876.1 biopolymer transporter ExbD [Leptospiraceae bacterium]
MRYVKRKTHQVGNNSIDMSSLMDIIFILLIFVMMSVSFAKNFKQLEIDMPDSKTGNSELSPDIQISIKANDKYFLDSKEISFSELSSIGSKGQFNNKTVSLNVEKKVPYEKFIQMIDILKLGNTKKINLGTE